MQHMVCGVILAAGMSSRMAAYKPLLPIGDTVFIRKLMAQMRAAGAEKIIIVAGHCHAELEKALEGEDVCLVLNENYERSQMLDSVKLALMKVREINGSTAAGTGSNPPERIDRILLSPADVVMSPQWVFDRLVQENADFAGPDYQGRGGHPVLIGGRLFDFILNYGGEGGLHGAVAASGVQAVKIPVHDPNVLLDADTQDDYREVLKAYKKSADDTAAKTESYAGSGHADGCVAPGKRGYAAECAEQNAGSGHANGYTASGYDGEMQKVRHQNLNCPKEKNPDCRKHFLPAALSVLAVTILISLLIGRYAISASDRNLRLVMENIRIPRVLLACMVGAALSSAGAAYQGVLQNAIASPDILGASSGAAFGAALAILMHGNSLTIMFSAFGFAVLAVLLACLIAKISDGQKTLLLVLAGMTVGAVFTAGTSCLKLIADPGSQLGEITFWLMGSLSGAKKRDLLFAGIPMLLGGVPLLVIRWRMNLLTLGDEEAHSLGAEPEKLRILTVLCATLLTAAAVSVSGMIGWIGLVVPHLCRRIIGDDYRHLLPATTVTGAVFLLIVDDLARNLLPTEIPIGILTALIGAPFFIFLLMKGGDKR